jgi:hypothetical protein
MKHKFKIGDWVIALGIGHTMNNSFFPIDKAWRVGEIYYRKESDKWHVSADKSVPYTISGIITDAKDVRLALQHEIPIEFRIKQQYYFY